MKARVHGRRMSPLDTSHTPSTGERLAAEWARLRHRPSALRIADTWALTDHPVTDLGQILRRVGYECPPSHAADDRLRRLVLLAAHDDLAARVVVQRIVPGLLAVVRRRRHIAGDDAFDELLGVAWLAIRTFNPTRRPSCLAAALISDADYHAFRAPRRRHRTDVAPLADAGELRDDTAPHPADELTAIFAEALAAGVPTDDITLLRQLIAAPTANELAARLAVTPRTIRNRRDRITGRLRAVTLAA